MTDKIARARLTSRITTWILRILVVGTIVLFLGMILVASLSGTGPMQKKALENILSLVGGARAQVHVLNDYQIFPDFTLDFGDVVWADAAEKPVAVLGRAVYQTDAMARFTGRAPIYQMEVQNFLTAPGFFGPYSLHIRETKMQDQNGQTDWVLMGDYGGYDVTIRLPVYVETDTRAQTRYALMLDQKMRISSRDLGIEIACLMTVDQKTILLRDIQWNELDLTGVMAIPLEQRDVRPSFRLSDQTGAILIEGQIANFAHHITVTGKQDATRTKTWADISSTLTRVFQNVRQKDEAGKLLPRPIIDVQIVSQDR